MIFNLDGRREEMTDVGHKCREVLLRMKQEIENFDPDADYSEDQIVILSLQIMSSVMPAIDRAMEAMQEAQDEDPE